MDPDFKGRRALVTGAGTGLGRATALRLAELGAKVIGLGNIQSDLDSLKKENPNIDIICVDLCDWTKSREAIKKVTPIQMLVNNAGVCARNGILDIPQEEIDFVFGVNVKALLSVTQVVASDLIERKEKGSIVNLASITSMRAYPNFSTYCASKCAVASYTRTMAIELGAKGIRVNAVSPSVVMTSMGEYFTQDGKSGPAILEKTPVGQFVEPKDIVDAIVFLLSEKSSMVNGHNLLVDGGLLCS